MAMASIAIYGHLWPSFTGAVTAPHQPHQPYSPLAVVSVVTLGALLSTCEAQWTIALELLEAVSTVYPRDFGADFGCKLLGKTPNIGVN